ncbi:MAG: M14 family zinc carboxypeptidase [Bacteroidota bacterium]
MRLAADSVNAFLELDLSSDTLWVAAQELQTSKHVQAWCEVQSAHPAVQLSSIGKSREGRELWCLDIGKGDTRRKEVIVVLGRQHPPEVTGWFAMQAFVEELLAEHRLAQRFMERYRILVFPLLNPDGVDLGHWRHNAGGIDLNRDWGYYHQPEARHVANYVVETVGRNRSDVILGLDFHSTY